MVEGLVGSNCEVLLRETCIGMLCLGRKNYFSSKHLSDYTPNMNSGVRDVTQSMRHKTLRIKFRISSTASLPSLSKILRSIQQREKTRTLIKFGGDVAFVARTGNGVRLEFPCRVSLLGSSLAIEGDSSFSNRVWTFCSRINTTTKSTRHTIFSAKEKHRQFVKVSPDFPQVQIPRERELCSSSRELSIFPNGDDTTCKCS